MVHRWWRQFYDSRTDVKDKKQGGRPSKINTNTISAACFLIKEEWCRTMDKIVLYLKEVECNPLSHLAQL